jgi:hypothetical protein
MTPEEYVNEARALLASAAARMAQFPDDEKKLALAQTRALIAIGHALCGITAKSP